ncbi:MAG TPA: sigma-70 family RNA polymerase sigma factor [Pyrinomonadaceae bacterium]|nr:sigma-70 family RNA polymerase sigma factor [Pyrinomonadaceae bacterium]
MHPEQAQISDSSLLKAVAAGDEAALALLYDRYRLILFGLLTRILNSRAEAEDVLQELFLQVWRRACDFDDRRGRPFTWLVTLARSRAIDRLRLLASRDRLVVSAAQDIRETTSDAVTDTLHAEQMEIVNRALAKLTEEQREVLLLAYLDGMTQSEIAAKLNAPLGTVKTRMRSGMIKLRELLGESLKFRSSHSG